MEIKVKAGEIILDGKILNDLDKDVLEFVRIIKGRYVIISGYVAIVFGRPRTTEDVDIFVEMKNFKEFDEFYGKMIKNGYYCMSNGSAEELYGQFGEGLPLRIAKEDIVFPNFEIKRPMSDSAKIAIGKRKKLSFDSHSLFISPPELQIAYKLYLGGDKDYEDARFLYMTLKAYLDRKELKDLIGKLKISTKVVKKVLGDIDA